MSPVTRKSTTGLLAVSLALMCGSALAQEVQPPWAPEPAFSPSNESIDKDLDTSLEGEFSDERGEPVPDYAGESKKSDSKRDSRGVRLRLMGAYWRAHVHDLRLSYREGTSGGETIIFNDDENDSEDDPIQDSDGGSYHIALDLGKYVTISTGIRHARFRDTNTIASGGGFTYGDTSFNSGDELGSEFEYWTADLDVALNALNNDYVTLSVGIGLRYTRFETSFAQNGVDAEENNLEAVVPAVSLGFALRPVKPLEFFARARIGHLSYETDEDWVYDDDDDEWDYREAVDREATFLEIDLGVSVTIAETIGFVVGYRFDQFEIERLTADSDERIEGAVHGLYGGLLLSF
jgi:hypothetical protein